MHTADFEVHFAAKASASVDLEADADTRRHRRGEASSPGLIAMGADESTTPAIAMTHPLSTSDLPPLGLHVTAAAEQSAIADVLPPQTAPPRRATRAPKPPGLRSG